MFKFRSGLSPHHTALAMVGAKAGQTVYIVTDGASALPGEVARVTGLNGRTVASGLDEAAAAAIEASAAAAGSLVEIAAPFGTALDAAAGTCDVVVLDQVLARTSKPDVLVAETVRILRPGGRVVVVLGRPASGWFGRRAGGTPALGGDAARAMLERGGFRATRVLGAAEGVEYVEGVR